jgi:hypothetical protein
MSYELLERAQQSRVVEIRHEELAALLADARLLREEDTRLCGSIRVLQLGPQILIQEQSFEGQPLIRLADSAESAQAFVEERLATYERMWDGCGCRIDHFA